jgi:hypothetical protein
LWGGLSFEQHVVEGITIALAVAFAFFPRGQRTIVQVAALAAAITILFQCSLTHWFYLYIVWFFPLVMVAILGIEPAGTTLLEDEPASAATSDADRFSYLEQVAARPS